MTVKLVLVVSLVGFGSNTYLPTAYATVNQKINTVTLKEDQNPNDLSKLEIKGIKLNQTFLPDVKEYSAMVENEVSTITVLSESENSQASITINGETFSNGIETPLALQTGVNIFLITVSDNSHSSTTYTLTVTRKQSNNNLLQTINLSNGELSPKFDSNITSYSVKVENKVDTISLTPVAIDEKASIKVNDSLLKDGGISIRIPEGKSDITILVTAENGDQKTYTLQITREEKQEIKPPVSTGLSTNPISNNNGSENRNNPILNASGTNNRNTSLQQNANQQTDVTVQKISTATLSSLTVSEGTWDSSFLTNEFTYHLAVASDIDTVTINPVASYSGATFSIEGSSSGTVQLIGKKTIISVVVTKGEDRKTYVLVFDRDVE